MEVRHTIPLEAALDMISIEIHTPIVDSISIKALKAVQLMITIIELLTAITMEIVFRRTIEETVISTLIQMTTVSQVINHV